MRRPSARTNALDRIAPLLLGLVTVGAMALVLWGFGRYYFGAPISDLVDYFHPQRWFLGTWIRRGVFPLWDPHNYCGVPVVEIQQTAMFHPLALASLLLPSRLGLLAFGASLIGLASVATYAALRRLMRFSRAGAALGAMVNVLGGLFVSRTIAGQFTVLAALAMMPLAMGLVWRAARTRRGALPMLVAAGVANALVMLAGAPQYVVYLIYIELVMALLASGRSHWLRGVASFGAAWSVAALVAAPQWLPALSYIPFSCRAEVLITPMVGRSELLGVALEALLPFPLGDDISQPHLHAHNVWEMYTYPGVVALTLVGAICLRGLARRRLTRREVMPIAILLLSFYLMAGGPAPGMGSFRGPTKARAIAALAILFAVPAGFDAFRRGCRKHLPAPKPELAVALVLAVCAAAGAVSVGMYPAHFGRKFLRLLVMPPLDPAGLEFIRRATEKPELASARLIPAAACTAVAALVVVAMLVARRRAGCRVAAFLWLFACGELVVHHWHALLSRHEFAAVELPVPLREFLEKRLGEPADTPWRVSLPSAFPTRSHFLPGLEDVGGYEPLMPEGAGRRNVLRGDSGSSAPLDGDTVRAITGARRFNLLKWKPGLKPEDVVTETQAALATLERRVERLDGPILEYGPSSTGVHFLTPSSWAAGKPPRDKEELGRLDAALKMLQTPAEAPGSGDTVHANPTGNPGRMDFQLNAMSPALLVVRTNWLPGWQVSVDEGRWKQPLCANFWMLAVPLEAGEHHVMFRYRPRWFGLSLGAMAVGLAFAGSVFLWSLRRRRSVQRVLISVSMQDNRRRRIGRNREGRLSSVPRRPSRCESVVRGRASPVRWHR